MINRWKELARFGVMHSMATSLFFWFWLVRNETMDSLHHHQLTLHKKESSSSGGMPYLMNITHPGKNRKKKQHFHLRAVQFVAINRTDDLER